MKNFFLIFFLLVAFKTYSINNNEYKYLLKSNVNLRQLPSESSKVIKVINKDENVSIDSLGIEWCKVNTNDGLSGYVNEKYLLKKNKVEENYFANINWKKEIIYFFLKIILALCFSNFSFKYLLKMESRIENWNHNDEYYEYLLKKNPEKIPNEYKTFMQINKYVFPIVIILISLIFDSWLIFFVCLLYVWFKSQVSETSNYKFETKSGKEDKRYTKNQEFYSQIDISKYYEIADRAINVLWIYLAVRIIIYIVKLFV